MNIKCLILFFLIAAKGFSQESGLEKSISGPVYSISYTSDWKLDETKRNGADFFLFHSLVAGKFGNNINLLIQNLEGMDLNLATYTELSENQIASNGKLISSQRKSANEMEFQELKFEALYNGVGLKFLQRYFIKNDKAYILTYTAQKSEFEGLLAEAIKIIDSFKLKQ